MLKEIDDKLTQGTYLNFIDKGYVYVGAPTKRFEVSETGGSVLGVVRWFNPWRKYCFFANNIVLEEKCMADISEFIKLKTAAHKAGWKG